MRQFSRVPAFVFLCVFGAHFACATGKIPRTNIDDTDENREVLALVEDYQRALENRDADAVLAMVSPRYYEDNGNTKEEDDYNFDGLKETLHGNFERTKAMQIQVRVDAIEVDDEEAYAELYFTYRAQNEYPSGTKWETGTDRTRLTFALEDGHWRIRSGL